jgi:NAD+ synthase (glutamine-hydrolysing)
MNICIHQINTTAGDLKANCNLILQSVINHSADIHLFPELCLSGYGCEDWMLNKTFIDECHKYIEELRVKLPKDTWVIFGSPYRQDNLLFNSAIAIYNGSIRAIAKKQCLPNHSVFSEKRYFTASKESCSITVDNKVFLILICFDIWNPNSLNIDTTKTYHGILSLNASPYYHNSLNRRLSILKKFQAKIKAPIFYCNTLGTQDQYVFDGTSLILSKDGEISAYGKRFSEDHIHASLILKPSLSHPIDNEELIYKAIVQSIHDFVNKNAIQKVIIGLSGGIDSALTLALAYDALGPERIATLTMPSEFSSQTGIEDSNTLANNLNVDLLTIPITKLMLTYQSTLSSSISCKVGSKVHQNLQARIRANLLMAMSNDISGSIVLATSNKSEIATGYSTLYGDAAGAYAPINDLCKRQVYLLAKWRNSQSEIIPTRIIERPPSAELAPNQSDSDDLPPYEQLDPLIENWIQNHQHLEHPINKTMKNSEFKRKQSPIGPRVNRASLGKDWRFPITQNIKLT